MDDGSLSQVVNTVKTDEKGQPLRLYGRYTDQIAYSADGALAYIAGADRKIYVFDTQTRSVAYTLNLDEIAGKSAAALTSLAVNDDWLYVTEGSYYGREAGRLLRINVNPLSQDFLKEVQVVQLGVDAPFGFQDMAISNGSYLALTAPMGPGSITPKGNMPPGNVYVLDMGKIGPFGQCVPADNSSGYISKDVSYNAEVITIPGTEFGSSSAGRWPAYISADESDGVFLLSNAQSKGNNSLVRIKVSVNPDTGNLENGSVVRPIEMEAHGLGKKFDQNIRRSADTVVVELNGEEYALVADYNILPDRAFATQQVGGKIGVIRNPFGKNNSDPEYLGATTPITGGAVDHLTLGQDGKLYADVFITEPGITGSMYRTLFVWDAAELVKAALKAVGRVETVPIDRDSVLGFFEHQIPAVTPQRYNGVPVKLDDGSMGTTYFGWTYGIGAYAVPGRQAVLGTKDDTDSTSLIDVITGVLPPPSVDENIFTNYTS